MTTPEIEQLCGERLGKTKRRTVYVYKPDPRYVIKVPGKEPKDANEREYRNGQKIIEQGHGDMIAKCRMENGCIIMERTTPLTHRSQVPQDLPRILDRDNNKRNWGEIGDKVVKHDYHLIRGK